LKLHFEKHGEDGIPIVILHGFLGSGENWRSIAKILAEDFTVYLPDLRNHGKSGHDPEMSYSSMSNDLAEMISDTWSLDSVHLVGHSMGGKLALAINEQIPKLVDHLYVLDISSKEYTGGHESILLSMKNLDLSQVAKRSEAGLLLSEGIPNQTVRNFLLKNLVRSEDGSYDWRIGLDHLISNYSNLQVGIELDRGNETPLSLLYGTGSDYVNATDIEQFKEDFDQVHVYPFETGHWIHAEQADEVIAVISDTVKK